MMELTRREEQVAHLVSKGMSNKQIAASVGIHLSTVKQHVSHIMTKTGLRNRTQVAAYVLASPQ